MTVSVQSLDASRPRVIAAVIAAVILAPVGALVCSLIGYGLVRAGIGVVPLGSLFAAPIVFPFPVRALSLLGTLLGLVVLAAVVLLISALVARSADRRRGFAAVLFGTWLAVIVGGWLAALAASPLFILDLRIPGGDLVVQVLLQRVGAGGGWGLYWGWITGLVCALIFTATNRKS